MLRLALTFLIIGLIAGLLGLSGIMAVASDIAWVLFLVGLVFLILEFVIPKRSHR